MDSGDTKELTDGTLSPSISGMSLIALGPPSSSHGLELSTNAIEYFLVSVLSLTISSMGVGWNFA